MSDMFASMSEEERLRFNALSFVGVTYYGILVDMLKPRGAKGELGLKQQVMDVLHPCMGIETEEEIRDYADELLRRNSKDPYLKALSEVYVEAIMAYWDVVRQHAGEEPRSELGAKIYVAVQEHMAVAPADQPIDRGPCRVLLHWSKASYPMPDYASAEKFILSELGKIEAGGASIWPQNSDLRMSYQKAAGAISRRKIDANSRPVGSLEFIDDGGGSLANQDPLPWQL